VIPTATNVDHVAITVPDLDEAVRFFVEVIGAELILREGPFEDSETDWMHQQLRMDPRASLTAALLRLGPTLTLELYGVHSPRQRQEQPQPDDVGGMHLSFHVTDLEQAAEYLREQGLTVHGEPVHHEQGNLAGCRWLHFEAPWGLVLEIVSWPAGSMPYESTTSARIAPPCADWQARS
jgi:catechol 2,3-dioxygenase-like lactoylglutathione lyase family enzyme